MIDCYFVDNEESLLTCACDGSIRLWNVKNGEPIVILLHSLGYDLICVDRSIDDLWFAQGTIDHGLQLISVRLRSVSLYSLQTLIAFSLFVFAYVFKYVQIS